MSATITAVPPRAEVPVEQTWALETVFATDSAWEEAFASSGERLRAVEAFRGRVADGPATLLAALRAADDLTEAVWKVLVFALLRRSEDGVKALLRRARAALGAHLMTDPTVAPGPGRAEGGNSHVRPAPLEP